MDGAVFTGLCDLIDAAKTRTVPFHMQGDRQVESEMKRIKFETPPPPPPVVELCALWGYPAQRGKVYQ